MNPFVALPPRVRAVIYWITFALGVGLGAVQLAYDTANLTLPVWLVVALKVLPFVAAGFGITAASNTVTRARRLYVEPVQVQDKSADDVAAKVVQQLRDANGRFLPRA